MCCGQKRLDLQRNPARKPASTVVGKSVTGGSMGHIPRIHAQASGTVSLDQSIHTQAGSVGPQVSPPITRDSSITVRYVETSRIRVRGPFTGLQYDFSGSHPVQAVDVRDAESLLNTRFFRKP